MNKETIKKILSDDNFADKIFSIIKNGNDILIRKRYTDNGINLEVIEQKCLVAEKYNLSK